MPPDACKARCRAGNCATTPTPACWRSTRRICARSAPRARAPWPRQTARGATPTARRCSFSAMPSSPASPCPPNPERRPGPGWRCAANSCKPLPAPMPSACVRTNPSRSPGGATASRPTAWSTTTAARYCNCADMCAGCRCQAPEPSPPSPHPPLWLPSHPAGLLPLPCSPHESSPGLHHRRLQRHWPGAGPALSSRGLSPRPRLEPDPWAGAAGIGAGSHEIYRADVAVAERIIAAGQDCIARQGLPDVVIANAGISVGMDTAERDDIEMMARPFATNNIGMAATFQPFVNAMARRRSGTLVGISSVAGIRGLPGHGAYCASKAAVISYCESLRGEMRPHGVRVVTLLPGYIDTPLTRPNRYRMPFLMLASDFADRAFRAIGAGLSYQVIPWQMGVVATLLRMAPNALLDRLLAGRPRKRRQTDL